MADRKNQHYVPKAYLKPWTSEGEGKAISLFNITRALTIYGAPVKNQCSRDFFYGKDLIVEDWLADVEGVYGRAYSRIRELKGEELADALNFLRDFSYLLYVRTERSIEQDQSLYDDLTQAVYKGEEPDLMEHETAVKDVIGRWYDTRYAMADLKSALIKNGTDIPFITSDDPTILTNKLSLQKHKMGNTGTASSGTIMYLPLAPDLGVMYYDEAVYSLRNQHGRTVTLSSKVDIHALNDLQVLKAKQNLYFRDLSGSQDLAADVRRLEDRRLRSEHRLNILVPAEGKPNAYRMASAEEAENSAGFMLHMERVSFEPERWPTFMRYRSSAHGYSNGSAAGYVRRAEAIRNGWGPQCKTKVNRRPMS